MRNVKEILVRAFSAFVKRTQRRQLTENDLKRGVEIYILLITVINEILVLPPGKLLLPELNKFAAFFKDNNNKESLPLYKLGVDYEINLMKDDEGREYPFLQKGIYL